MKNFSFKGVFNFLEISSKNCSTGRSANKVFKIPSTKLFISVILGLEKKFVKTILLNNPLPRSFLKF